MFSAKTKSFAAGAIAIPVLFAPVAVTTPAVAKEQPSKSDDKIRGKKKKASRAKAPSRSRAPHKFGTVRYNKWYAYRYMDYKYGWGKNQRSSLAKLWTRESGWNQHARNPYSGAHGIPQALPGGKMASHGKDWRTNPETQIKWGLSYIKYRYKTPNGAWQAFQRKGWY